MMSQKKKIHSESDANISVPFNWEKQPGVSKLIIKSKDQIFFHKKQEFAANLPPPPCWPHQKAPSTNPNPQTRLLAVSSLRGCSKRGLAKQASFEEDPFLVAFKECTKTKSSTPAQARMDLMMVKKSWFRLCCNKSCGVRDDALVKNQVLATYD